MDVTLFLDAPSHLYKRSCPSVRRSVRRSVGPSVPRYFQTRTRRILCRVSAIRPCFSFTQESCLVLTQYFVPRMIDFPSFLLFAESYQGASRLLRAENGTLCRPQNRRESRRHARLFQICPRTLCQLGLASSFKKENMRRMAASKQKKNKNTAQRLVNDGFPPLYFLSLIDFLCHIYTPFDKSFAY